MCIFQRFKVRKLISTRYELNQPVFEAKDYPFIPQINLLYKTFNYNPKDYNSLNNKYVVSLPTEEELEWAQKYKNKVPDYKVATGEGEIHTGVIIDSPSYSSYMVNPSNEQPASIQLNPNNLQTESSKPL